MKSTFTLFVANRHRVYDIRVDSLTYIKTKVGQRITIKMQVADYVRLVVLALAYLRTMKQRK